MKPKLIAQVLARDGGQCIIAGPLCTGTATVADHRANRGSGGSKVLDGAHCLVGACRLCNGWKETVNGAERAELIRRGVRVEKAATNAQTSERARHTPVQYPDGSWWVLLPEGTRIREEPF